MVAIARLKAAAKNVHAWVTVVARTSFTAVLVLFFVKNPLSSAPVNYQLSTVNFPHQFSFNTISTRFTLVTALSFSGLWY